MRPKRSRPGWEPEMPRGPRCGKHMKAGKICVRRAGHPGYCWSAQAYRTNREATDRWRAQWGTEELDPVRALRWGQELLNRKRAEWRAGITEPGAGRR